MNNDQEEIDDLEAVKAMWLTGIINWKLHEAQMVIDNCIANLPPHIKEVVILCCRRFGKSFYGVGKAVEMGLRATFPKLIRIIGPDIKQTEMIVGYNMAKITQELDAIGLRGLVDPVKSEKMFRVGEYGHIFLGGFDSQADSLRGGEAHEILIEESGFADPDQYTYQMKSVLKPQLLKTRGRMIHLTTLPKIPGHPFIKETIPKAKLNNAFYSYTIYEDPLATPEIIQDAIEDCGGITSEAFRREYLNEVIRERSIVLVPDWNPKLHVAAFDVPNPIKLQVYCDFGGVRDKTAALLMGYDFLGARDLVIDELVWDTNTSTEKVTNDIKEAWLNAETRRPWVQHSIKDIYVDAQGQTKVDITDTHGLDVTGVSRTDWEANVNAAQVRFTKNKALVHERCKFFIETCDSGTFNKNKTDFDRTEALGHMDGFATYMYGNRHLDRSSPFDASNYVPSNQWVPPKPETPPILPQKSFTTTQRKVFGSGKR